MMEPSSITTRARAQKLNNFKESTTKSKNESKRSVTERKSANAKDALEATTTRQNAKKKSLDTKVTAGKSKDKKTSSRRLNTAKDVKSKDKAIAYKDKSPSSNELTKVSKNKHNDFSEWIDLKDLNKTPEKVQRKIIVPNTKEQSGMVTPKSTPIKLSLTPHRSTKTPKKSPISLSSPKTHSVSVSKLLKTPRKLSLTPGENLYKYNNDSSNKKSLRKAKKDNQKSVSVSNESSPASLVAKSKHTISSVKLKRIAHRFSKSPKIVLKSPSKKSRSPKLNISVHKKNISKKSLTNNVISTLPSPKNTSLPTSKNVSVDKRWLLNSKLAKSLTASQMRDILAEPIVLLKKLSLENRSDMLMAAAGGDRTNHSISTKSDTSAYLERSSRRSSIAKAVNRSVGKLSPTRGKNKTSTTPLMSSTPREEIPLTRVNLVLNTSIPSVVQNDTAYPNTRSKYTNQSGIHASISFSLTDKSVAIEDLSKPSLLDVDIDDINEAHFANVAKQDTTYDVDQVTELKTSQNNKKDVTYELKNPQTPGLQKMTRKRSAMDANFSIKENAKKSCRVRFANIKPDKNGIHDSIDKPVVNQQSSVTRNNGTQRNISIMNSAHKSRRFELFKFSQDLASPLNAKSSPKMSRVTPRGRLHNLRATSLTLEKIQPTPKKQELSEKKSEKKSSVKKVPNFRRIHEKMFAKSESIVDAKKRLANRHLEFGTTKKHSEVDMKKGMKLLPSDTTNGTYNRFGFKLRKAEATHVILKKQTVFSRQKQQHETRTVLKSVRTNRRFELQMKARNLNPT